MTGAKIVSLHAKLAEVMAEVERIPKNGTAPQSMGGFKFVQVGDAADAIRVALAKRSVSMLPSAVEVVSEAEHATKSGGTMTTQTVRTTWTLTDGESGQTAVIQSLGTGADSGDKFSPKAQTNAMKYALLMGFLLSTGDDPEQTDTSDRGARTASSNGRAAGGSPTPAATSVTSRGEVTRAGYVTTGDGSNNQLDAKQTPDGYHVGFRLEIDDDKAIPQVYVQGPLGHALVTAIGDPKSLLGQLVEVTGELLEVREPNRRVVHRLMVSRIQTPAFTLPAQNAGHEGLVDDLDKLPF